LSCGMLVIAGGACCWKHCRRNAFKPSCPACYTCFYGKSYECDEYGQSKYQI